MALLEVSRLLASVDFKKDDPGATPSLKIPLPSRNPRQK